MFGFVVTLPQQALKIPQIPVQQDKTSPLKNETKLKTTMVMYVLVMLPTKATSVD